jgi:hypothetical protein
MLVTLLKSGLILYLSIQLHAELLSDSNNAAPALLLPELAGPLLKAKPGWATSLL